MEIYRQIIGSLLGLAVGSFLGVVIERGPRAKGQGLKAEGRSRCLTCGRQLEWWENIPILSYIFLLGKCRTCRSPIPYWLPLIELAGAAAGAAIAAQIGQISPIGPIWLISQILIAAALVWIFFSDLVKGVVPDWAVVLGSAGAGLSNLTSAAIAAAFFWLLAAVTRGRGMGTGDITLAFFLGLWLGWPKIAVAIWLAFLIGAIVGLGLILLGRKKFGQTLPFGPFLITGAIIAYFYGGKVLSWFL